MSLLTEIVHCAVSVVSMPGWTVQCIVLAVNQPPDSPNYALHSFGSQSPSLPMKIAQFSHSHTGMFHVSPPVCFDGQIGCHEYFYVSTYHKCSSTSQQYRYNGPRNQSQRTPLRAQLGLQHQVSRNLPIYGYIKLFIDKDIKMKWRKQHNEKHHR